MYIQLYYTILYTIWSCRHASFSDTVLYCTVLGHWHAEEILTIDTLKGWVNGSPGDIAITCDGNIGPSCGRGITWGAGEGQGLLLPVGWFITTGRVRWGGRRIHFTFCSVQEKGK